MPVNPASVVAALLNGSQGLVLGTNLFLGEARGAEDWIPSLAVFCLTSGGAPPVPYLSSGTAYYQATVQIRIRAGVDGLEAGETLGRALLKLIHMKQPAGCVASFVREAHPLYMGTDEANRPQWVINARVEYVE